MIVLARSQNPKALLHCTALCFIALLVDWPYWPCCHWHCCSLQKTALALQMWCYAYACHHLRCCSGP